MGIDGGFKERQHIADSEGGTGSGPVQTGTKIALSEPHFPLGRGGRMGSFFRLIMGGGETEISSG